MPNKAKFSLPIWAGVAALLAVAAVGLLVYKFYEYGNAGLNGLQNAPQTNVAIIAPQPYSSASVQSPLPVNVSASGYQPLTSIELWVNGVLMGIQAAPPEGLFNFNTAFLWTPGAAGEYSLVARALDSNGDSAVSPAVMVKITPFLAPEGAEVAFEEGPPSVLPAAPSGAPSAGLPGANESVGDAGVGAPSVSDWMVNLMNKEAPQAPELAITVQGCSVNLNLHDLSDNEEGFQVFRSLNNSPAWAEIASLNSQSALDWITYQDELAGGNQAVYYVVAVNGVGQAKSNLAAASIDPADCPIAEPGPEFLTINPQSLVIDLPVDKAYCYRSLGGLYWQRWPTTGFFTPNGEDKGLDVQGNGLVLALNGLDGEPIIETQDLKLECWGWTGGHLEFLGQFEIANEELLDLGQHEEKGGIFTLIHTSDISIHDPYAKYKLWSLPESAQMPYIHLVFTYDQNFCVDHLPADAQNFLGALLFCSPWPGYTLGAGTASPQPYLIWWVSTEKCPAGEGADCRFLDSIQSSYENGSAMFEINGEIHGDLEGLTLINNVPFERTSDVANIASYPCDSIEYSVAIKIMPEYIYGPASNSVFVPCTGPLSGEQVGLDVTFTNLSLSSIDDGESAPEDLELYGVFQALSSNGSVGMLKLAKWGNFDCSHPEGFSLDATSGIPTHCPRSYGNGGHSIADMLLCTAVSFDQCTSGYEDVSEDFYANNNTIHLTVEEGDQIVLQVMLMDWDDASANEVVCFVTLATESKTLQQWANTVGQVFTLSQAFNGDAACNVTASVSVAP